MWDIVHVIVRIERHLSAAAIFLGFRGNAFVQGVFHARSRRGGGRPAHEGIHGFQAPTEGRCVTEVDVVGESVRELCRALPPMGE